MDSEKLLDLFEKSFTISRNLGFMLGPGIAVFLLSLYGYVDFFSIVWIITLIISFTLGMSGLIGLVTLEKQFNRLERMYLLVEGPPPEVVQEPGFKIMVRHENTVKITKLTYTEEQIHDILNGMKNRTLYQSLPAVLEDLRSNGILMGNDLTQQGELALRELIE